MLVSFLRSCGQIHTYIYIYLYTYRYKKNSNVTYRIFPSSEASRDSQTNTGPRSIKRHAGKLIYESEWGKARLVEPVALTSVVPCTLTRGAAHKSYRFLVAVYRLAQLRNYPPINWKRLTRSIYHRGTGAPRPLVLFFFFFSPLDTQLFSSQNRRERGGMNTIQGTERDPWIKNATHRTRADPIFPPSLFQKKICITKNSSSLGIGKTKLIGRTSSNAYIYIDIYNLDRWTVTWDESGQRSNVASQLFSTDWHSVVGTGQTMDKMLRAFIHSGSSFERSIHRRAQRGKGEGEERKRCNPLT